MPLPDARLLFMSFSSNRSPADGLPSRESGELDVKVSAEMLERAMEVMSQVVAVLERQDFSVEISEQGLTTALIKGEHVSFGTEEQSGEF
jgi:hypothetical protein